eukprot:TRINITY_DN9354_c0_g10_i1.p1 TRINITY_DN9354_c0_g10~~TRINITY_DN9354_c0_g10_i1.p1  ORF type:complete len:414 (-),score=170.20 TRINITY_DN9354_c0_g10_i1:47-1288(-)
MEEPKKKIDLVFSTKLSVTDPTEESIRSYLENNIVGIKIKSLKLHYIKNAANVIVKSNVLDLLFGTTRSTLPSIAMQSSLIMPSTAEDEEASRLREQLKKVNEELKTSEGMSVLLKEKMHEIDQLKSKVENLSKEVKETKSADKKTAPNIAQLLSAQIQSLTEQIGAADMERYRLEQENNKLKERIKQYVDKEKLDETIKSKVGGMTAKDKASAEKMAKALKDLIQEKQVELEKLHRERDEARLVQEEKVLSLTQRLTKNKEKVKTLSKEIGKIESLEKKISELEAENEKLGEEVREKRKIVEELNGKVAVLQGGIEEKMNENDELSEKLGKKTKENDEMGVEIQSLNKEIERKKEEISSLQRKYDENVETQKVLIAKLTEEIKAKEENIAKLESDYRAVSYTHLTLPTNREV